MGGKKLSVIFACDWNHDQCSFKGGVQMMCPVGVSRFNFSKAPIHVYDKNRNRRLSTLIDPKLVCMLENHHHHLVNLDLIG